MGLACKLYYTISGIIEIYRIDVKNRYLGYNQCSNYIFVLQCGVLGAVVAPIILLGGPILTRAAWYTAGK